MNQTVSARENRDACLGDNIRFFSVPSMPYLWFEDQRTGRFVLGQCVLAGESIVAYQMHPGWGWRWWWDMGWGGGGAGWWSGGGCVDGNGSEIEQVEN